MTPKNKLSFLIWDADTEGKEYDEIAGHVLAHGFYDLSHISLMEIEEDYKSFQIQKVVLFNNNRVTEEEALRILKSGEYHPSVIALPKLQWEQLFLNREEM